MKLRLVWLASIIRIHLVALGLMFSLVACNSITTEPNREKTLAAANIRNSDVAFNEHVNKVLTGRHGGTNGGLVIDYTGMSPNEMSLESLALNTKIIGIRFSSGPILSSNGMQNVKGLFPQLRYLGVCFDKMPEGILQQTATMPNLTAIDLVGHSFESSNDYYCITNHKTLSSLRILNVNDFKNEHLSAVVNMPTVTNVFVLSRGIQKPGVYELMQGSKLGSYCVGNLEWEFRKN